jgi:hypothetical protein
MAPVGSCGRYLPGILGHPIDLDEFQGTKYSRIKHIKKLLNVGRLDSELRWNGRDCSDNYYKLPVPRETSS